MIDYLTQMWALATRGEKQGILFFIAAYAFVLLTYSVIFQLRVRSWPAATGVLLHASVQELGATTLSRSAQDYAASALYEYVVDGVQYHGSRVSPWVMVASHNVRFLLQRQLGKVAVGEDGTVQVFFDPRKPAKSFLIRPGLTGLIITLTLALGPAAWYWLTYHR